MPTRGVGETVKVSGETYELFVSPGQQPGPLGLLVWIGPKDNGLMPPAIQRALEGRGMMGIAPHGAGNSIDVTRRCALAIEAVKVAQARYELDLTRVYVGGFSGGAKVASLLGFVFPQVFRGVLAIGGAVYWRPIEIGPRKTIPVQFETDPLAITLARTASRFAILIGEADESFNLTKLIYERGFLPDHFRFVRATFIPALRHEIPREEDVRAAMEWLTLDEPVSSDLQPMRAGDRSCRICGCTELKACPGGCWWVLPDVCSTCARHQLAAAGLDPWQVVHLPKDFVFTALSTLHVLSDCLKGILEQQPVQKSDAMQAVFSANLLLDTYEQMAVSKSVPMEEPIAATMTLDMEVQPPRLWRPGDPI
jgi:predicted esterase